MEKYISKVNSSGYIQAEPMSKEEAFKRGFIQRYSDDLRDPSKEKGYHIVGYSDHWVTKKMFNEVYKKRGTSEHPYLFSDTTKFDKAFKKLIKFTNSEDFKKLDTCLKALYLMQFNSMDGYQYTSQLIESYIKKDYNPFILTFSIAWDLILAGIPMYRINWEEKTYVTKIKNTVFLCKRENNVELCNMSNAICAWNPLLSDLAACDWKFMIK